MHITVPPAICGLSLGVTGLGIMWLNLSRFYEVEASSLWFLYLTSLIGVLCLALYTSANLRDPVRWWQNDVDKPAATSVLGAMAMAICLLAITANHKSLSFPFAVPFTISIIGSILQVY